jgi:dynein light chain roadblock-type
MDGVPIKSTINEEQKTYFYTTSASIFIKRCKNLVNDLIPKEELTFIRIRTKQNEIMIAPGINIITIEGEFILIVIQNPSVTN